MVFLSRESKHKGGSSPHVVSTFLPDELFVWSYAIPTVAVCDVSVLFRVGGESMYYMDF
jgi:hypothetical protein